MTNQHRLRRCAVLHIAAERRTTVDLGALLAGRDPIRSAMVLRALAPHLGAPVDVDADQAWALLQMDPVAWLDRAGLAARHGDACIGALIARGLLLAEGDASGRAACDQVLREHHWHAAAAFEHAFSRWSQADAGAARRKALPDAVPALVAQCGPPPPHFHRRVDAVARVALEEPARTALDDLLERRVTCRNFDLARPLPRARLSALLHRVFGAHGTEELAPGAVALKKNHPSGGGLHPIDAYLIVQRVVGVPPGLYHYNAEAHALDELRALSSVAVRGVALTAVAGQGYFADAPVLVVLAARFARSQWKYRNHPKLYRAIVLEAGHISQNIYLTATEMNLGAFITAAINEVEIEQAFGLEPMAEGSLCVCGFGARATARTTVEFDPGHKVWPKTPR